MNKNYLYTKFKNAQRGAIMVLFAVLLPVLFGFMGFSIDLGLAYVEHGKMQDIADAAALAGAAHLGDSDRDTTVKDAVKAYVEANGIKLGANDLVNRVDGSAWDAKDTLAKGQDALVSYSIVSVTKDGETRDRVRVRITKRVPVVFLSMVDGIADNIVVSAKAAAEGGGEETEEQAAITTGLRFLSGGINLGNINNEAIVLEDGFKFDLISTSGQLNYNGLPKNGNGTLFQLHVDYNTPAGYEMIPVGSTSSVIQEEEKKKASEEAEKQFNDKKEQYYNETMAMIKDIDSYKRGEGNKRFIEKLEGYNDPNDKWVWKTRYITNIKPDDVEIELFFQGNDMDYLNNECLQNVKYIKKMVSTHNRYKGGIINTNGIRFGDIYTLNTFYVEGENNSFDGLIYSNDRLYVKGLNNKLWQNTVSEEARLFGSDQLCIGYGLDPYNNLQDQAANNDWHIYIGNVGAQGSTDNTSSSGEGNASTGKLRLVE